ncbi:hypothetical protein AVEN_245028-1 [Araneus ventricosus]|uniref:Uncharacterized protein n=1 Tax=Araneus ventricosus TaxID=182803 RepID=A0A4Y2E6L4_ARAVE|nr:hypothetical protein AVEN_245028-1 [Araneus ventricosus]
MKVLNISSDCDPIKYKREFTCSASGLLINPDAVLNLSNLAIYLLQSSLWNEKTAGAGIWSKLEMICTFKNKSNKSRICIERVNIERNLVLVEVTRDATDSKFRYYESSEKCNNSERVMGTPGSVDEIEVYRTLNQFP